MSLKGTEGGSFTTRLASAADAFPKAPGTSHMVPCVRTDEEGSEI
jgi:hypothetical protein